jgi:hypothetical protein
MGCLELPRNGHFGWAAKGPAREGNFAIKTQIGAGSEELGQGDLNQTGFTGEHKAWKVSHDQRKFREPFFDRSAGACSAFGA